MFEPLGTPDTMTVRGTDGSTFETDVYPSSITGLGICKPQNPCHADEWGVVHLLSGMLLTVARSGQDALYAASALGFAASSAGAFWEWPLDEITANEKAMTRCAVAVRTYTAR